MPFMFLFVETSDKARNMFAPVCVPKLIVLLYCRIKNAVVVHI
jgi:hypothetical protein